MTNFFAFWSTLLDINDLYLYLDLYLNKRSLDLELNLNQIAVLKEILFNNEQVTIIICVKITIVITRSYIANEIICSEIFQGIPRFRPYLLFEPKKCPSFTHLPNHLFQDRFFAYFFNQ